MNCSKDGQSTIGSREHAVGYYEYCESYFKQDQPKRYEHAKKLLDDVRRFNASVVDPNYVADTPLEAVEAELAGLLAWYRQTKTCLSFQRHQTEALVWLLREQQLTDLFAVERLSLNETIFSETKKLLSAIRRQLATARKLYTALEKQKSFMVYDENQVKLVRPQDICKVMGFR